MKKLFNDARVVFTALQVCSVIAVLAGLAGLTAIEKDPVLIALRGVETALWCVMWLSFLRMCGRLKREASAFTDRNARTLLVIGVSCGATGMLLLLETVLLWSSGLRGMLGGGRLGSLAGAVIFFGGMTVALVLRRLLRSAMALELDNDLTI